MPNPMSPDFCPAFTDHQHRYAFARTTVHDNDVFECACGQPQIDARDEQLVIVDENTDVAALPFAFGYSVEDYPQYLRPENAQ